MRGHHDTQLTTYSVTTPSITLKNARLSMTALNVGILSVAKMFIMTSVVMLSAVMLNVAAPMRDFGEAGKEREIWTKKKTDRVTTIKLQKYGLSSLVRRWVFTQNRQ